uniref:Si:dkey-40c11.2 n=1 Tax=Mastacembelus armatus TaxID=205130 RepID=A0A3Q3LV04_9TELE
MSTRTVNLDTYSLSLFTAKEDILNPRSSTNWALFAYDGVTNKLKLADSGAGGVSELAGKFHISKPQYGLCKLGSAETGGPQIAMISWVDQSVDDYRRNECASHIPAIKSFFKEAHVFISAEKVEDVTEENIRAELKKASARAPTQWARRSSRSVDNEEIVGTNYRKTNAAMEMRLINRDSFWARAEEERKDEERRRAAEERRHLERERILKERRDAEERDRKMNEKLQIIEEQRKKQAEQEEEMRRKEKLRWELQQKEHEEDMRARLRRSESIEKAAEAAALVSQRSINPREFFRQLSSSSSQSPTSPGSSRTGKPFRRYQRSLTDTAFIFSKAEESAASSPRSSPVVSPFSRAPPSPIYRTTSPPMSPDFRPVTSPQKPRAPMSPPTSPLRPAPPISALPILQQTHNQVQAVDEPKALSPTEPSAPPASPSFLVSLSPNFLFLWTLTTTCELISCAGFCVFIDYIFQSTDIKTASLVSDTGYKVQAVLVEEDEEEDVEEPEEEEAETQAQPCAVITEPEQTEAEEHGQEEELKEEEEDTDEQEKDEDREEVEVGLKQEGVPEDEEEKEDGEENNQSEASQATAEPNTLLEEEKEEEEESAVTGSPLVLAERQMCVRALYDYQAEDESEISFEPGDIITDVETVDKAWWRGWSKDGRQGLFPANYVETI